MRIFARPRCERARAFVHSVRMPSRVEGFLAHLDRITGGVEPLFLSVPRSASKLPEVTVMAYQGLPEDVLTAVTYGVSFARHAEWRHGSAELCLSVRSADLAWAHALGALAEACREVCPFTYGTLIDFGQRVSAESSMTAFAVFSPLVLERAAYLGIDLAGPGAGA